MPAIRVRGIALPGEDVVDFYAAGDRWTADPVADAELVAEGWLLPGLVDAHAHQHIDRADLRHREREGLEVLDDLPAEGADLERDERLDGETDLGQVDLGVESGEHAAVAQHPSAYVAAGQRRRRARAGRLRAAQPGHRGDQAPGVVRGGVVNAPQSLRVERGARTGQPVIISLDSTQRGPALGGCRVKPYASWRDGLEDALRLSAAMTAKAALADMPYGGGKTVVALSPDTAAHYTGVRRGDLLAAIGDRLGTILDESARSGLPPLSVTRQQVRERLS